MQIENRVFLITGAGSGLGAAVARMAVAGGGRAALLDVNEAAGRALADELGAAALFVRTDVTSGPEAEAAIAAAVQTFGRLDVAVNCAGVAPGERIVGRDGPHALESFARAIGINLIGTFNILRLAADVVLAVVVHGGKDGQPVLAAYVVVVRPVAGSDVHGAGAGVRGYEVRQDDF